MGGDDLSKGNQILIWIKSNIPSNSHWASKGQAGIEFPFCCRTGRREANCSKNDKQGIARQGIEPKHQAGLILLMDLLQEICFNFGNRGEELGDFRMKTPNLRDFGMFVLLFQAEKCAFFSGNSPWWMFHGTTCPFGNSTCGICPFQLHHPHPVTGVTRPEGLIIFSLYDVTESPEFWLQHPAWLLPCSYSQFIPLFVHHG